ncbi:hypothetical protein ACFO0N_14265 [Halobium salinum]|uniref:C2H2-type domain-containing protein n=1 Tax=Halobium salinum TaxID=1364940 RepID=A0ABD5PE11_9EURY|nr:hypothetical protein [Halobium salinum]
MATGHRGFDERLVGEPAFRVPHEVAPPRCPYCDRPFATPDYRALHVGERHPDRRTAAERDAYERAVDAEADALFVLQLKLLAALVALYFVLFVAYGIVWTG